LPRGGENFGNTPINLLCSNCKKRHLFGGGKAAVRISAGIEQGRQAPGGGAGRKALCAGRQAQRAD